MNITHSITLKGFAALLLGVTMVATSCKKDDPIEVQTSKLDSAATLQSNRQMATTTTTSNNILFQSSFEDSNSFSLFYNQEAANSNSITRVTSPVRTGSYSAKFLLNKTDADVAGSKRAELVLKPESTLKVERWYGVSMNLPSSYVADPVSEIVLQWHEYPDFDLGETWRSPPIHMQTVNGRWKLTVNWATEPVNTDRTISGSKAIDLGAYQTGSWTDWVFHIKFSYQSDGLLEVWKNGQKVYTLNGPNNYNDKTGNFFKMGIYKWGWKQNLTSTTTQRVIYYDNLKVGNQYSSYNEVAPSASASVPTTTPTTTEPAPTTTAPSSTPVFAVNAGGSAFTGSNGIYYQADTKFSGGSTYRTTSGIANTTDDALFQSERFGNFGYAIPVTNGTYEITFKLAEIYHSASGMRQFDILAENSEIASNLDLFSLAGKNNAYQIVKTVTVSDGTLNLNFRTDKNNAKLSAFHVIKK